MNVNYFKKFSGAGNDFILFDATENPNLILSAIQVQSICDRRNGVGADGVIVINDHPDSNFQMTYYNSDGSLGSLCGNGARCAIKYASLTGRLSGGRAKFFCNEEVYSGNVRDDDNISFNLHNPKGIRELFDLDLFGKKVKASFADTGSPHVVINIDDVNPEQDAEKPNGVMEHFPVMEWGRAIRYNREFEPAGTNVNFIKLSDDGLIIRTYERGVENETLACGTGSVAAAVISSIRYDMKSPVKLSTRGGDILTVSFSKKGSTFDELVLTGPAKQVFKGEIILSN